MSVLYAELSLVGFVAIACSTSRQDPSNLSPSPGVVRMYGDEVLTARLTPTRIRERFHGQWVPALPPDLRSVAQRVTLDFPLRGTALLQFYSIPRESKIVFPVESIQFFDDLLITFAWLQHHKYNPGSVLEYLCVLKYSPETLVTGNSILDPRTAIGIPGSAMDEPDVAECVDKLFGSAMVWMIGHELGHIINHHSSNVSAGVSRQQEMQADELADSFARHVNVVPVGVFFYLLFAATMERHEEDFASSDLWVAYVNLEQTHPLSRDRIADIASRLRRQPEDYFEVGAAESRVCGMLADQITSVAGLLERKFAKTTRLIGESTRRRDLFLTEDPHPALTRLLQEGARR